MVKTENSVAWDDDFQKCVEFHGHACPGLAMGYVAVRAGMSWLGENRAEDEEVVAIVETDSCAVDAIQAITGCTFGKGNFLFRDFGKTAFTFLSRTTGKGIRFYAKPGLSPRTPEYRDLSEKVSCGSADASDLARFDELHRERTLAILRTPAGEIYELQEIAVSLPPRARILESAPCSRCGEWAMTSRLIETAEDVLCRPCFDASKPVK